MCSTDPARLLAPLAGGSSTPLTGSSFAPPPFWSHEHASRQTCLTEARVALRRAPSARSTPGCPLPASRCLPRGRPRIRLRRVGTHRPVRVPSSWFPTTSTACSTRASRACCIPLPVMGFIAFPHPSDVGALSGPEGPFPLSSVDAVTFPRRGSDPSKESTHRQPHSCHQGRCPLDVQAPPRDTSPRGMTPSTGPKTCTLARLRAPGTPGRLPATRRFARRRDPRIPRRSEDRVATTGSVTPPAPSGTARSVGHDRRTVHVARGSGSSPGRVSPDRELSAEAGRSSPRPSPQQAGGRYEATPERPKTLPTPRGRPRCGSVGPGALRSPPAVSRRPPISRSEPRVTCSDAACVVSLPAAPTEASVPGRTDSRRSWTRGSRSTPGCVDRRPSRERGHPSTEMSECRSVHAP